MGWVYLLIAAAFEIAWAVGLKYTQGFTKLWPTVFTVAAMLVSFGFLSQAVKTLPLGTAYATWTGIGAVGTAVYGMIWLGDPATTGRLVSLMFAVAGVVGLKVFHREPAPANNPAPPAVGQPPGDALPPK